ncbi:PEPxxWA-CTERM sorting domain-containing protein [Sphingomonas sp.]|uniref:PEPxxWA-CTERM sorting domain-containing protein n=1 Tax=Sphingomonas sp. TaxID=28214 RepID=UPI003B3A72B0
MKKLSIAACAAAALVMPVSAADAARLAYTLSGTFDIQFNGTRYDDLDVTFTGIGGTENSSYDSFFKVESIYLDSFIASSSIGTFDFGDTYHFFVNLPNRAAGFADSITGSDLVDFLASGFGSYHGKTEFAERTVTTDYVDWTNRSTAFGTTAMFNAGDLTFGVAPAPVPEPANWVLMLGGFSLLGGVLRQRRRVAVSFA